MWESPQQLMLFTEDSLVSPSAWLETRKDKTTRGIYGRNFRGWSMSLNLVGLSLKTFLVSSTSRLTQFAKTWSVKTTASGFGILKLRLSALNTEEKESFLWRTPDTNCYRGAQSKERFSLSMKLKRPLSLNDQVAHLLPTPTANNAKNNNNHSGQNRHSQSLDVIAGGSLNPVWVEALMGFPPNWTEV